jgi:hypothetical protein
LHTSSNFPKRIPAHAVVRQYTTNVQYIWVDLFQVLSQAAIVADK